MSPRDRDKETGQFSQQYDTEDFIRAIEAADTSTTSAVADHVGCSYDLAYRRLQDLEDQGEVTGREVGGSFLWQFEE